MSGGVLFDYTWPNLQEADGKWHDNELDELYHDLFCGGEFSVPLRRHARKREGRRQRLWRQGVVQDRREERTGNRREVEGDRGVG